MLTCIACSKRINGGSLNEDEDGDTATTPRTKQAVKTLTSQIKDIALKASGAYRNCKPSSGSSNGNQSTTRRCYTDSEGGSVYQRTGSSTPRVWGKEMEARLKGISSGASTPASVSGRTESVVFTEEEEVKEWVAQVEPGVLITFVSLPHGGNDLKRIRFSREMFNKWRAQRWWSENCEKIMELYNVQQLNQQGVPLPSPPRSEDESSRTESVEDSPVTPPLIKEPPPRNFYHPAGIGYSSSDSLDQHPIRSPHESSNPPKLSSISGAKMEASSVDASARTSSSREVDRSGELCMSNASDLETEWVEQDEPGVYITIRTLPGGIRELRRVRFRYKPNSMHFTGLFVSGIWCNSRERFGEMHARMWWEQNRARIQQHTSELEA
ncbi:hypothetical protein OSB04_004764 [Centaurea solstitialis]|uniref:BRX domain-containing protein n=1 Tax=Centaurea solstitialis TaxID=347529 RepID=A0AA38TER1_9ASTR|nr:hypothetical protein OSB04_004764 [Centaurea solstitialis]